MAAEPQFPELDEPRIANGQTVGEYLDYLFGSTKDEDPEPVD